MTDNMARLDKRMDEARKAHERATKRRAKAIRMLISADKAITKAERAMGRTQKRKTAARAEFKKAQADAAKAAKARGKSKDVPQAKTLGEIFGSDL